MSSGEDRQDGGVLESEDEVAERKANGRQSSQWKTKKRGSNRPVVVVVAVVVGYARARAGRDACTHLLVGPRVHRHRAHEAEVHAEGSVLAGAVQAHERPVAHRGPLWGQGAAVRAVLVAGHLADDLLHVDVHLHGHGGQTRPTPRRAAGPTISGRLWPTWRGRPNEASPRALHTNCCTQTEICKWLCS
jgi:hypothetical protein